MFIGSGRYCFLETYNREWNDQQQGIPWVFKKNTSKISFSKKKFQSITDWCNVSTISGSVNADRFELLCRDGLRRPLSEYRQCNWGLVPSHALVTSSARTSQERKHYQQFLTRAVQLYSSKPVQNFTTNDRRYEGFNRFDTNNDNDKYYDQKYLQEQQSNQGGQNSWNPYLNSYEPNQGGTGGFRSNLDSSFTTERSRLDDNTTQTYEKFEIFESERYGGRLNLMFQDAARNLVPIKEDDQSFGGYLGSALQQILEVRQCPVGRMTLCVTSDAEMDKCIKMRVSFDVFFLQ